MAKNKLKNCKVCNAEIAQSAKVCPSCGAKNKKSPIIPIIIVVLIVLIAIIASSGNDEPTAVENSSNPAETTVDTQKADNDKKTEFNVGETAQLKGVNATLVNVSESAGSAYNKPADGNVFVLCEFEIENTSNKELNVSSMMSFEAYCDDYTCTYSLPALLEKADKNQLDGTVATGKKFNGIIGYEVPAEWNELEIHFTPDIFTGKEMVFVAKK